MEKWEYKVVTQKMEGMFSKSIAEDASQELTALGEEGWELVSAAPIMGSGIQTNAFALFLKRRVS